MTVSCPFCNGNHGPNESTEISNVEQRLSKVKHQRLCYNCLGTKCRSRARCIKCHRKHHTSICSASNYSQPSSSSTPEERPEATSLHSTTTRAQTNVLLKTAISYVGTGNTKFSAGILFDEGSQRSYITQELTESLQLPVDGTEMLSISSFGVKTCQPDGAVRREQTTTAARRIPCQPVRKTHLLQRRRNRNVCVT